MIASNPLSYKVNYNLQDISQRLAATVQRVSSGLRINNASDDPAAFAVSESMRADIASFSQGERNLEDAISLVQTASAALDNIDDQLVLMKELAEEASTGTYTDDQRTIMQSEFSSLGAEIDRIANSTVYNTMKLLNGSLTGSTLWTNSSGWQESNSGLKVHFGSSANRNADYYYVSLPHITASGLFNSSLPQITSESLAETAITKVDSAIAKNANYSSYLGGLQNRLSSSLQAVGSQKENLQSAYTDITNADMADEVTDYLLESVQMEFAVYMSAQANVYPQLALKLLNFD
jgi:flagellin